MIPSGISATHTRERVMALLLAALAFASGFAVLVIPSFLGLGILITLLVGFLGLILLRSHTGLPITMLLVENRSLQPAIGIHIRRIGIVSIGLVTYYGCLVLLSASDILSFAGLVLTVLVGVCVMLWSLRHFLLVFLMFVLTFRLVVWYADLNPLYELLPIIWSVLTLALYFYRRAFSPGSVKHILALFLPFILIFVLSSLINNTSLMLLLSSTLWYFYGFALFISVYSSDNIPLSDYVTYAIAIILALSVQLPIQILQQIFNPIGAVVNPDSYSGTFGYIGTISLGVFLTCLIVSATVWMFKRGIHVVGVTLIALSFVSSIIADISFVRYAFLACIPFILLISIVMSNSIRVILNYILRLCIVLLALIVFVYSADHILAPAVGIKPRFSVSNMFNFERLDMYNNLNYFSPRSGEFTIGRQSAFYLAFSEMISSPLPQMLIGYGPGSTSVSRTGILSENGPLVKKVGYTSFYGLDRFVLELGLLGFASFIIVLLYFGIIVLKQARASGSANAHLIASIYLSILFVFVLSIGYDGGWFTPYQKVIVFWLLTAGVLKWFISPHAASVGRTQSPAPMQ